MSNDGVPEKRSAVFHCIKDESQYDKGGELLLSFACDSYRLMDIDIWGREIFNLYCW